VDEGLPGPAELLLVVEVDAVDVGDRHEPGV
jgi:hypothetical protein